MGRPLAGAEVVVAGAGGAAHAVVFALLTAGVARVTVGSRSVEAARALATRFGGVGAADRVVAGLDDEAFRGRARAADLAVNATTVGMIDPGMTIDVAVLSDDATVFDLVYVPPETPLLAAARARGLRAANGSEMLDPAGGDRVRALDRRRRHGRRDADRRRAAPRRPDGRRSHATRESRRGARRVARRRLPLASSGLTIGARSPPAVGASTCRRRPAPSSARRVIPRPPTRRDLHVG